MIGVGTVLLIFPGDFGTRQATREEDLAVAGPACEVRAAAAIFRVSVRGGKPHRLTFGYDAGVRAVSPGDTEIAPIVTGIGFVMAILVGEPLAVRRPARGEIEMRGGRGHT